MLFSRAALPGFMKQQLCVDNIKPSLRPWVINTLPGSLQEAIASAVRVEEQTEAGLTPEKLRKWEKQ